MTPRKSFRLTVRDEFAKSALQGMLASTPLMDRTKVDRLAWAKVAYEFADAMLAARKLRPSENSK